ncbi:unnamed protein product [Hymenolepis diminuta]|uniref:Uncharacterized protein n=1 Tax=Hymenolepis diminuta TaxID=6216 RepID=A0A3P6ZBW1_HYMDI|nr:unnamed protein product [Hymenolepis diminuta]
MIAPNHLLEMNSAAEVSRNLERKPPKKPKSRGHGKENNVLIAISNEQQSVSEGDESTQSFEPKKPLHKRFKE